MKHLILTTGKNIVDLSNHATKLYNISKAWSFKAWSFRIIEIKALQEYRKTLILNSGIDTRII